MISSLLKDVRSFYLQMLGFYIYQFLPIMLLEALVLWRLKWSSFHIACFDSLLVNSASFIILLLGLGPYITGAGIWGLTLFGTYSIMVEGAFLMMLERHSPKKVWIAVIVANIASCIMLGIETLFTVPTKG